MSKKKDPGRFTIRFNFDDPRQRTVVEYLNQQGRLKAQFLTGAVLHYVNCTKTKGFQPMLTLDKAEIEKIVLSILENHNKVAQPDPADIHQAPRLRKNLSLPDEGIPDDFEELFGAAGVTAIVNTVAAFQQK